MRYEITCKAHGHGFSLFINNPIDQTVFYDPHTGAFELKVFEQLADLPNAPKLVSSLSITIQPKQIETNQTNHLTRVKT